MAQFIDRRPQSGKKNTVNRQRFIQRHKKQIKKAISEQIGKRSITDVESGESVSVPSRDLSEPTFHHTGGGKRERVHPGNKEFVTGDRLKRPLNGQGGSGSKASNKGEGQDDFAFNISKDEYLELLFDDLELPNLKKNQLRKMVKYKTVRAGFTTDGVPSNINIVRSLKGAMARRMAMGGGLRGQIKALEEERDQLLLRHTPTDQVVVDITDEIEALKARLKKIPFIDTFDLRFNNFAQQPQPSTQAVMFCIMDVSGSMDRITKDTAKRFFILLYLFLSRTYKDVEVVFIRHHTQAKEVDEHEFFYSQETGGTIVSSALHLSYDIITDRYPSHEWNIYCAQASDGDNWHDDSPLCRQLLQEKLLPLMRYFAYVEITKRSHQSLWAQYNQLNEQEENFAMQHIQSQEDIYPVFRELFKRQKA